MGYQRFRVIGHNEDEHDLGPDLLRTAGNTESKVKNVIGGAHEHWKVLDNDGLVRQGDKADAMHALGVYTSKPGGRGDLRFYHGNDKIFVVRFESVAEQHIPNCSARTILNHSLIEHQWRVLFGGGYVYRQIAGSSSWSDHAWGTAIDETENPSQGARNDDVFDWCRRMGAAGCMQYDYALGSRNGRVVTCGAPHYEVEPSSAASTHLWHVHMSIVDHDGRKPPRPGGVF